MIPGSTISWPSLFVVLFSFVGLNIHFTACAPAYVYALCPDMTSVAPNSKYQANIYTLLSYLSSNSSNPNHFYNTTVGTGSEKVYGLAFCRADVTASACQKCVSSGTNALTRRCPGKRVSTVWYYDSCVVRYSNESFIGFMQVLLYTLGDAAVQAASGQVDKKFARKQARFVANLTNLNTLYTLVECTPDISLSDCKNCLDMVIGNTSELCNVKAGCTLMCPNCILWYDVLPFYGDKAASVSGRSFGGSYTEVTRRRRVILVGAIAAGALAGVVLVAIWIFNCKRKAKQALTELNDMEAMESLKFDFSKIRSATTNFSEDRKLGEGGFGEVYKGKLKNGQLVAIKRLSRDSKQGTEEFKTEVLLLAKLQHRNLVKLLGFCLERTQKLLVYEFLPNSSLDRFLFDPAKCASLNWETKYKIIHGIGRGLLYLHEDSRLKIIHRDLKASNILLDKDMNPKISDFGMAGLFGADETQRNTCRIAGTFGYMAPEYVITGQFSAKSDVYSFGIIVMEIISGQRNNCSQIDSEEPLLRRAWRLWNEELVMESADSMLGKKFPLEEVGKCIHIGLLCIQEDAGRRPRMASVVAALNGDAIVLPSPTPPHLFTAGAFEGFEESEIDPHVMEATNSMTVLEPR